MSSPKKRYDICAGRPYGDDKKHWINVGRLTEWDDGGLSIELHSVPTGNWFDGRLSVFEQKPREGEPQQTRQQQQRPQRSSQPPTARQTFQEFEDDDIPL
jgi:hypothetical protein